MGYDPKINKPSKVFDSDAILGEISFWVCYEAVDKRSPRGDNEKREGVSSCWEKLLPHEVILLFV